MRKVLVAAALATFLAGGLAAQEQDVYKIGDGVTSPVLIKEVKPKYTEGAMRRKVAGVVELSVVVKKDGDTGDDAGDSFARRRARRAGHEGRRGSGSSSPARKTASRSTFA